MGEQPNTTAPPIANSLIGVRYKRQANILKLFPLQQTDWEEL